MRATVSLISNAAANLLRLRRTWMREPLYCDLADGGEMVFEKVCAGVVLEIGDERIVYSLVPSSLPDDVLLGTDWVKQLFSLTIRLNERELVLTRKDETLLHLPIVLEWS